MHFLKRMSRVWHSYTLKKHLSPDTFRAVTESLSKKEHKQYVCSENVVPLEVHVMCLVLSPSQIA
ncbi:unnamed protein product, partial [Caenorhabditis brenneri]